MQELPFGERSAKHILFHIFKQIVNYKKQDSSKGEVRTHIGFDFNINFALEFHEIWNIHDIIL